ncbi:MAG: hypothetical protein M3512_15885 [Bacteroidota bacterium]|nr:hypothetical protein [Bacteroidota bacterium]
MKKIKTWPLFKNIYNLSILVISGIVAVAIGLITVGILFLWYVILSGTTPEDHVTLLIFLLPVWLILFFSIVAMLVLIIKKKPFTAIFPLLIIAISILAALSYYYLNRS